MLLQESNSTKARAKLQVLSSKKGHSINMIIIYKVSRDKREHGRKGGRKYGMTKNK